MWTFLNISRGQQSADKKGLGVNVPHNLEQGDDEFDAYRKRMMLAYRFRPNPLVSFFQKKIQILKNLAMYFEIAFFRTIQEEHTINQSFIDNLWITNVLEILPVIDSTPNSTRLGQVIFIAKI